CPFGFDLGGGLGHLLEGPHSLLFQAHGEPFHQLPDLGALSAADALAAPGPAGPEVVRAGADALAEDHLVPLVLEEFGGPALFTEFGDHAPPLAADLGVEDGSAAVSALSALVDHAKAQFVDVDDVDPVHDLLTGQVQQPVTQIDSQVGVVGGEQDRLAPSRGKVLHQVFDSVQGHDGLSGAGTAADPGGATVGAFDELFLGGVQEHLPGGEVVLQDLTQVGVGGGDSGGPSGQCGGDVGGVDRVGGCDRAGDVLEDLVVVTTVDEGEQGLLGVGGGAVDQFQELALGAYRKGLVDQAFGDAERTEPLRGLVGEQRCGRGLTAFGDRRLRSGFRCGDGLGRGLLDALVRGLLDGRCFLGAFVRLHDPEDLQRTGDLVDFVPEPVEVVVDVLAFTHPYQDVVAAAHVEQQCPVVGVDPCREQSVVPFELLELQPGGVGVLPELVLEVVQGALDVLGEFADLLV